MIDLKIYRPPQKVAGQTSPVTDYFELVGNEIVTKKNFSAKEVRIDNNELKINQGQKIRVKEILQIDPATYQLLLNDFVVAVKDVGVARTIKLPQASIAGFGKMYVIKDASGSALTTTITISPNGTELIDGDTGTLLNTNFGSKTLYTNGVNWYSI